MFQHALAIAGHRGKKGASAITGIGLTLGPLLSQKKTSIFRISSYIAGDKCQNFVDFYITGLAFFFAPPRLCEIIFYCAQRR